jgi:hypothetical protein
MQISCFRVCSATEWVTTTNHHPLRSEPDYRPLYELSVGNFWLIARFCVRDPRRPVRQRATSRQRRGILARHSIANWCLLFPAMYCTCRKHTRIKIDSIFINVRQTCLCSWKHLLPTFVRYIAFSRNIALLYTSMIRLQYIHVASKKFISNCLRHIILINIF